MPIKWGIAMNKIQRYAKHSTKKLDLSIKERNDLYNQFVDHMTELYNDHLKEGFSEEESIDYAIKKFKDSTSISNEYPYINIKLYIIILIIFTIYCVFFFCVYFGVSRHDAYGFRYDFKNIIPFRYITINLKQLILYNSTSSIYNFKLQLPLILAFIPIGFFMPIVTNKYKSFMCNLKVFIFIVVFLQLIKLPLLFGRPDIDYALLHLCGCLLGYSIYKLIFISTFSKIKVTS